MADPQSNRDRSDPSGGVRDRLDFDHHREERSRLIGSPRWVRERSSSADHAHRDADDGWRGDRERETLLSSEARYGGSSGHTSGSQEFGRQGYGGGHDESRHSGREWTGTDAWRVPGPFTGRGPRGYQRSDDRIREELNDRLTAHGFIDATDIECRVQNGEVTLGGFVGSREAKRAVEDVAEAILGVVGVHNNLRIRSREDTERIPRTKVPAPAETRSRAARSPVTRADTRRLRGRLKSDRP